MPPALDTGDFNAIFFGDVGVEGRIRPGDVEVLDRAAAQVPHGGTIVEIGSFLGLSARVMERASKASAAEIHCVDPWPDGIGCNGVFDSYARFLRNTEMCPRIHPHRMLSMDALSIAIEGAIELLYIDGEHEAPGPMQDLGWLRWVPPGRLVLWHDCHPGSAVWDAVAYAQDTGLLRMVRLYRPPDGYDMAEMVRL